MKDKEAQFQTVVKVFEQAWCYRHRPPLSLFSDLETHH